MFGLPIELILVTFNRLQNKVSIYEMAAPIFILYAKDTCNHFNTGHVIIFDPKNMDLETIIVHLSVKLGKRWQITDFRIMAPLNLHKNGTWDIIVSTF